MKKKPRPGRLPDYVFRFLSPAPHPAPQLFSIPEPSRPERRIIAREEKTPAPEKSTWFDRLINWIKGLFA